MPELRTFVLTRAGLAGIQRYAANWMGDNQSRWDHLWVSIPMAAGFGLSGQPFVGADVGGFMGDAEPEMFLRWMQYGALTPFCRNHSMMGNVDQYAWSWGETVLGHVREAIELRYRLLPYLYAAFVRASETGAPVQRPLVFDFQHDAAVRDIDDEYLLGPRPARRAGARAGRRPRARSTCRRASWYDWHTGERHAGGRWVVAPTPMERIPLFARAGAVDPDVAAGAAVDVGLPPGGRRAARVRAGRRRRVDVAAAGGRRAHARGARGRAAGGRRSRSPARAAS